jgi:hypothetical protein
MDWEAVGIIGLGIAFGGLLLAVLAVLCIEVFLWWATRGR